MSVKTTIYLDIDGVVNVTSTTEPELAGWHRQIDLFNEPGSDPGLHWITYHPELVDRLNALAQRPEVEIVLASTWRRKSRNLHLAGLDCQNWEYLYDYERNTAGHGNVLNPEVQEQSRLMGGDDWKAWAMAAHQKRVNPDGQDRFLFIEDGPYEETCEWIDTLPNAAYLSTNTILGITAKQMDAIEAACKPNAELAALQHVQSLSAPEGQAEQMLHEIFWIRGTYRPHDQADLDHFTERGFRPGQPRDEAVHRAWEERSQRELEAFIKELNLKRRSRP